MDRSTAKASRCEFGAFLLDEDGYLHCPDGARIHLASRLAGILSEIAAANGATVSRLHLLERCWPDAEMQEDNLTRAVADLRRIFRVHGGDCIETVYGSGYRLNIGQPDHGSRETLSFCQEAWHRVYQRQRASLDSAEGLFTQAITRDERNLQGWLGLAETQIHRMQLGYAGTLDAAPQALEALDRALDLDSSNADVLAFKGLLLSWAEWDFPRAEELLERSCQLRPDDYIPAHARAWHELALGRYNLAESYARIASTANPLSMTARAVMAFARTYMGDSGTALDIAREMIRVDPYGPVSLCLATLFETDTGEPSEAVSMASRGFSLLRDSPVAGAILAYALARAGRTRKARGLLESQAKNGWRIGSNTIASTAWVELGENDLAIAALESGFSAHCPWLLTMLNNPRFEHLDCKPLKDAVATSH